MEQEALLSVTSLAGLLTGERVSFAVPLKDKLSLLVSNIQPKNNYEDIRHMPFAWVSQARNVLAGTCLSNVEATEPI